VGRGSRGEGGMGRWEGKEEEKCKGERIGGIWNWITINLV